MYRKINKFLETFFASYFFCVIGIDMFIAIAGLFGFSVSTEYFLLFCIIPALPVAIAFSRSGTVDAGKPVGVREAEEDSDDIPYIFDDEIDPWSEKEPSAEILPVR